MTKPLEKGFKVLHERHSCIRVVGRCLYQRRRRIYPEENCGPLCVFATEVSANRFKRAALGSGLMTVVPCLYKSSRHEKVWASTGLSLGLQYFQEHLEALPRGTRLAEFVTCLE